MAKKYVNPGVNLYFLGRHTTEAYLRQVGLHSIEFEHTKSTYMEQISNKYLDN